MTSQGSTRSVCAEQHQKSEPCDGLGLEKSSTVYHISEKICDWHSLKPSSSKVLDDYEYQKFQNMSLLFVQIIRVHEVSTVISKNASTYIQFPSASRDVPSFTP
jgi:hypothetical protein